MTLSELARLLKMPTSTCFGLLRTLEERGYLYEVGGRKCYYPTARWLAKARQIEEGDPIQDKLRPSLEKLREATAETVVLAKRLKDQVVFLERCGKHATGSLYGRRRRSVADALNLERQGSAQCHADRRAELSPQPAARAWRSSAVAKTREIN